MDKYKIVFWSRQTGSGTTFNMHAAAVVLASKYKYQMICRQSGIIILSNDERMVTITDCGAGMGIHARKQLEGADLIVVNFRQIPHTLDFLFTGYTGISKKIVYFISSYQKDSHYNKNYIYNYYRIAPEQLGVIPYNPEFQMACSRGRAAEYVKGKDSLSATDRRADFFAELERAAHVLLRNLRKTTSVK